MAGLPWIRFDTDLPDNPKVLALIARRGGQAAAFVYCCGLAYSGRHGTDGFIPAAALPRVHGRRADATALVAVGLWDETDDGWFIHGWDEYQQASSTSEVIRGKKREASRKGNCVRHHGESCGCWKRPADGLRAVR
ncbi:hypothetical protein [Blastococcus mobilis]|uniref:Uncharacterized protein n=1 Tax=Blastococcus mobilis TaxID=1938746 RepID=A0A238VEI2_9ACTN|nr:hypothetical protein [Blastococcus mobilis]SNR32805.1 hypothetical protein SAMN06272737_10355 [Blastococcus mobilis]